MMKHVEGLIWQAARWLKEDADDGHSEFGVHITFDDLYYSVVFLAAIYVSGKFAAEVCKMPSLVGEIVAGILLGPPLAEFVPLPEAFVTLGEIGLILLVVEAGIDIDLTTLKLIGGRGILIAIVGSILPIAIGVVISFILGHETKAALAAGASFGPTSLGIAMNILRQGKIVNTPVGQLIVSAAVIDDMIALIILSQLEALAGEITVGGVLIPIVAALAFLIIGGYIAVYVLPDLLDKYAAGKVPEEYRGKLEMTIMMGLLLALMPATYYAKASFLVGAFLAGLTFCRSHDLHVLFVSQFKRVLHWLMSIFFAASIGFQVPIKDFGSGKVIWQGLFFTLALTGKLAVGFMVPNFNQAKRFTGHHFRDVLVTGFSMAAEGEFAFVIAVFSVTEELIDKDLYASIVLAVLLSTIIPPFLLRYTIGYYNRKSEEAVRKAAQEELKRQMEEHDKKGSLTSIDETLKEGIMKHTAFFMCIQTQSDSKWGLLPNMMACLKEQDLETIDHRSWHARGVDSTLINEIYTRDVKIQADGEISQSPEERMNEVKEALEKVINQPHAKVKVQRWYPGVVEEIVEEVESRGNGRRKRQHSRLMIADKILAEAQTELEKKRVLHTQCTQEKTIEEILQESTMGNIPQVQTEEPLGAGRRPRRVRQKMRSTPVVGGDLFAPTQHDEGQDFFDRPKKPEAEIAHTQAPPPQRAAMFQSKGQSAELIIEGESFKVRISNETMKKIRSGYSGDTLDTTGISLQSAEPPVNYRLQGFVRNFDPLGQITEETEEKSDSGL